MRKLSCEIKIARNPFTGRVLSAWKYLYGFGIGFSAPSIKQKTFTFIFFFFVLFAGLGKAGLGQTTIWSEDFSYSNGANSATNASVVWNADGATNGVNYYGITVVDNQLRGRDTDRANPANNTWEIDGGSPIDISGYSNVSISIDISCLPNGELESNTDYIRLRYQIDGGGWVGFPTEYYNGEFSTTNVQATVSNLLGSQLQIQIVMYNTATNEYYYADNILVQGTCTSVGDPSVFGDGEWNVYAYNGDDIDLDASNVTYQGYYVDTDLTFDTRDDWDFLTSPSEATNYQGCSVNYNDHTFVFKRTNFECGEYTIDVLGTASGFDTDGHDDAARLYINGANVWEHIGCCDSHTGVWTGQLTNTSTVEFRVEEQGGHSYGGLNITPTILSAEFTASSTTVSAGETISFTDNSTGNPTSWSWSFPGGAPSSSTDQNPTVTYSSNGTYDISLTVTDNNGCTDIETKANYIEVVDVTYCDAESTAPGLYESITNVTFAGIDNSSPSPKTLGYSDFTGTVNPAEVTRGLDYAISISDEFIVEQGYSGYCKVYIDLDQSGDFDPSSELMFESSYVNNTTMPGTITIPVSAAEGLTRMRVVLQGDGTNVDALPCGNFTWGEVEDYSVNIILPCSNPTSGGTIAAAQNICSGDNPAAFTSSVAASGHTGTLEYKWQYSTSDSPYNWQETGVTGLTYDDDTNLTDDRWYQRLARVDCESDWSGAVASNVLKVTVSPLPTATVNSISSSICEEEDAEFTITGTSGAEVTYNINDDSDITATLTGGSLTIDYRVEIGDGNQTLNLVSVKNTATSCEQALNSSATITVNPKPVIGEFN